MGLRGVEVSDFFTSKDGDGAKLPEISQKNPGKYRNSRKIPGKCQNSRNPYFHIFAYFCTLEGRRQEKYALPVYVHESKITLL